MPIVPIPVVPNTPIEAAVVRAELNRITNWVSGGIVAGDLTPQSVEATAVFRPETVGFPKQNTECTLQRAGETQNGQQEPSRTAVLRETSRLRDRQSIFVQNLGIDEVSRLPHMSKREVLPDTSDVEISASWRAVSAYDNSAVGAPLHPAKAGIFVISYRKTTDSTKSTVATSIRRINVQYYATTGIDDDLRVLGSDTFNTQAEIIGLVAGVYDFWVEYRLDGGDEGVEQVIVAEQSFVVEIHQKQS